MKLAPFRSIEFFVQHAYIEWLRLPGDVLFIAGVMPLIYLTGKAVLRPLSLRAPTDPSGTSFDGLLFAEAARDNSAPEQSPRGAR